MLPLILLAGGAYLIGKAVLEDDKYAEGGMITSISEAKKVVGNVEKSNNEHFSWFVPDIDYEGEDYDQEYGVHLTDSDLMQLANELKGGMMADGGMVFKKGDVVMLKDGGGRRLATIVEDGFDKENRVRIRPEGFPMDISVPMGEEYSDDKRVYVLHKMAKGGYMADGGMMAKGGKVKQKFEYVNWEDISDDPKDNNKGFIYGINLIDEESGEVVDVEWFKTESLRDKAIKKYDLEEYEFESEMAKGGNVEGKSGSKFKIEMWNSFDDMAYEKKKPSRIVYSDSENELRELGEDNRSSKLYMKRKGKYMNITTFLEKGGEVKDYSGNYYSTYDFVSVNKLEKEANDLFGKDWEAEDDASQILELTDSLGGGYTTYVSEDDEDWQRLRYKHSLNNETNDSNYDIFVVHYGRKKKK